MRVLKTLKNNLKRSKAQQSQL